MSTALQVAVFVWGIGAAMSLIGWGIGYAAERQAQEEEWQIADPDHLRRAARNLILAPLWPLTGAAFILRNARRIWHDTGWGTQ